jgi:hypothetical protein
MRSVSFVKVPLPRATTDDAKADDSATIVPE